MLRHARHEQRQAPFGVPSRRRGIANRRFGGGAFHRRLRFEPLEDRRLLSITVNTLVDENDGIGVGGISLREAVAAAAPSEAIDFSVTGTINLSVVGQITINKNLTINGPGANLLTINAFDPTPATKNGDGSRIFNIDDGTATVRSVSINGLTLTGGDVNGSGGAIRNLENLAFNSSVVTGNTGSVGGGLYNSGAGAVLVLNDVTVSNNRSVFGGGIHNQYGILAVNNSTISGNVVTGNGGGIQNNFGSIIVNGSTIKGNNGAGAGGGILSYFDIATHVTGTTIQGNSAGIGGGIWARESTMNVTASTISGNLATSNGGGIYQLNGALTVNTTTLHRNTASNSGGGIFSLGGTAAVQNSLVSYNSAALHAGGIEKRNGTLNVINSTVRYNRSSQYGGGIWSYSCASIITGSTIHSNHAGSYTNQTTGTPGSGGGILQTYGSLTVRSSTISGNSSTRSGGGIYSYFGTLTVAHSTIFGNLVDSENFDPFSSGVGGGIQNYGSSVVLYHTIVARNFRRPTSITNDDIHGPVAARFSLIGSNLDATITNNGGNQIGTNASPINPMLGTRLEQGGQRTHPLLPGSPALDAGDPAAVAGVGSVPLNDQRGAPFVRIVDGNGIPGARIDIGAVEQQTVPGQDLVVDTLVDELDGDYSAGDLSLREAIGLANGSDNGGATTISFAPSLTSGGPAKILLIRGELQIHESVTIVGPGAELLTIDASGFDPTPDTNNSDGSRVFRIADFDFNSLFDVEISGLTLTGSDVSGGGSIYSAENLSLASVTISGNNGGGISHLRGGTLTVSDSTISGNSGGSGISTSFGNTVIVGSTITGNTTGSSGGGINNYSGNLIVSYSTISGNTAEDGGGIHSVTNLTGTQTTTILHSTISGNMAVSNPDDPDGNAEGGGIYNDNGLTVIRYCTITNNTAPAGFGSGILAKANSATRTEVYSTIITGNTNSDVDIVEGAVNSFQSDGYNLIGTGNAIGEFVNAGDQTGLTNSMLGPLADNGGPTKTHALLIGSPAIDAGDPAAVAGMGGVPEFDQRGAPFARVFDGDDAGGAQIDIGAYERQTVPGLSLVVDTLVDESDGDYTAGDLSLREAVGLANGSIGPDIISFAGELGGGTITLWLGELAITDALEIQGLGASLLTIDASGNDPTPGVNNGDGSRVFLVRDADDVTTIDVAISGLTLTGGDSATFGGAIDNFEILELTDCTLTGNFAASGGAIRSQESLSLIASTVSGNFASGNGGGIYNQDYMAISGSTISGNTAGNDGGGIQTVGGLTVGGSTISDNSAGGNGGGIYSFSGLVGPITVVTNCTVSGNAAAGNGGGVFNATGLTEIVGSTISDNHADGHGGGIDVELDGEMTILASTVSGNTADDGGGIRTNGNLTVSGSTLSGNMASAGGGIFSNTDLAGMHTTTVVNSTISGNTAATVGGGIYNIDGLTIIRHSTITDNTAPTDKGSGLASFGDAYTRTEVHSTIIAANTNSDVDLVDLGGLPVNSIQSNDFNLIGTGNILAAFNLPGDQLGVLDPMLGPLADNGGPTMTHALLTGSPAIDTGDLAAMAGVGDIPSNDQRGAPFSRVFGTQIDIGAVERQPTSAVAFGDYNQNGKVDAADYVLWRRTLGDSVTPYSGADGSGDGVVGPEDYDLWRAHFGETVPTLGAGSGSAAAATAESAPGAEPTAASDAQLTNGNGVAADATETKKPRLANPPTSPVKYLRIEPSRPSRVSGPARAHVATNAPMRRDDALIAWLTSRFVNVHQRRGDSIADRDNGSADHRGSEEVPTVDALDAMFASL